MKLELTLFALFVISVISFGIIKSKADAKKQNSSGASGYFLAGRGLTWWLVGFSLIASNISTEQFVGMSGQAANWLGMAIASYEWMAAITLVGVAFVFLPKFLRCGIYTVPQFLEYRYGSAARLTMAILTILILVLVPTATVIFSGAKFVSEYYTGVAFVGDLTSMCWAIAGLAALYVFIGGLRAAAVTDMIWGISLILGGVFVAYFAMQYLAEADPVLLAKTATVPVDPASLENMGAVERLQALNAGTAEEGGKLHMVRPTDDTDLPWTALVLGLWIPNFFYWGLNQYIIQRTLGSRSLAEGQKGIIFAAFMKLLIPFVVVIPGILAFNLFSEQLLNAAGEYDYDKAFPVLVRNLIRPHAWLSWFVIAALFGAVVSSLASMLNSASTVATMDLYQKVSGRDEEDPRLVKVGKGFVIIFAVVAAVVAPSFADPELGGVFKIVQEFQGFISPGILAIFLFGFLVPRAPRFIGMWGIVINAIFYGLFKWSLGPWMCQNGLWWAKEISFLDRMSLCFVIVLIFCTVSTILKPLAEPIKMPTNDQIDMRPSAGAKAMGAVVVVLTLLLYLVFW